MAPCAFQSKESRSRAGPPLKFRQARGEGWLSPCVALPKISSFIECREEDITIGSKREDWWGRKAFEGGDNQCIRAIGVRVDVLEWWSCFDVRLKKLFASG